MTVKRMDNVGIVVENKVTVGSRYPDSSRPPWSLITATPVNTLGYLRVMFTVEDIDDTLARVGKRGGPMLAGKVAQYGDTYRLCYIRGPEGIHIGLAQEFS